MNNGLQWANSSFRLAGLFAPGLKISRRIQ
jgi:hypothetical protein